MAHLREAVTTRDHIQGPDTAPVTLVEYGDYECPYCGMAFPVIKTLQRHFGDKMRLVFRHFPLVDSHPHAESAAEAAEAAGAQGHFWSMHELLYTHQQHLDDLSLTHYAQQVGADIARFTEDIATHTFLPRIKHDLETGLLSGVNGTPTFFINGSRYEGSPTVAAMTQAIAAVLPG